MVVERLIKKENGMKVFKDMFGNEIEVGNIVAYGKSNRDYPIQIGKVIGIDEFNIEVIGKGNTQSGKLKGPYSEARIIILPRTYGVGI